MKLSFPKSEILRCCRQYGPLLKLQGTTIDGARLLWAIAGCESSFGANCTPKFEPAYFTGRYSQERSQRELNGQWGEDGAKSYGPWQVMLVNALGYTPDELRGDVDKACEVAVGFINRRILASQKAKTLEDIGDSFNSGNYRDSNVPVEYIAKLKKFYEQGFPAEVKAAASGGIVHP